MAGQGSRNYARKSALLAHCLLANCFLWLSLIIPVCSLSAQDNTAPRELEPDAELTDVFFFDVDKGWAVGDRGVIWSTDDGGRHWSIQPTPVSHRLESISFIDEQNGWAVGGWTHPYTHKSSAIILRTYDGGAHWALLETRSAQGLKKVKFFDSKNGWALGGASTLHSTGVLRTSNGGRSWSSSPDKKKYTWISGDFRDPRHGVAIGGQLSAATVSRREVKAAQIPPLGLRNPRKVRFADDQTAWLVGDGGLVLRSSDAGNSWKAPQGPLPKGTAKQFDFSAVACFGQHCWIAGSPGSKIFHTSDSGKSWRAVETPVAAPWRAMTFIDENHGWIVGALGTIAATRDGGQTWRIQQRGGSRAALLALFSRAEKTPLELFSEIAANEGYLSVVELLNREDLEAPSDGETSLEDRFRLALSRLGACSAQAAWRFPVRQAELSMPVDSVLSSWTQGGSGFELLEEHIVRKIRQWRPDVVVTEQADAIGADTLSSMVSKVVLSALQKAADSSAYPDQITIAGLEPWQVKKAYAAREAVEKGSLDIVSAQMAPRLGASLADHAQASRGLLFQSYRTGPQRISFQRLIDNLPQRSGRGSIVGGLILQPGGEARRRLIKGSTNYRTITKIAQKKNNLMQILNIASHRPDNHAWLAQISELTRGLEADDAGDILYQLACQYRQVGRLQYAAGTFDQLIKNFPQHPLSEDAMLQLLQYHVSSEAAKRRHSPAKLAIQTTSSNTKSAKQTIAKNASVVIKKGSLFSKTNQKAIKRKPVRQKQGVALTTSVPTLAKKLERYWPAFHGDPCVRFPLAAYYRSQGDNTGAERIYNSMAERLPHGPWRTCAKAELALLGGSPNIPKRFIDCQKTLGKPKLDGKLDDDLWRRAQQIQLQSAFHDDSAWPAAAMIAYDDEFLYLAVSCRKATAAYPKTEASRSHDVDLSLRDRVDFLIDLDRDFATYYRLTVDYRGWTGEACLGDKTWNPKWFVAAASEEDIWTVEAAIPLAELSSRPLAKGDIWALGVQRTVPKAGFQSWTTPAAVQPRPEGFGYLRFQ